MLYYDTLIKNLLPYNNTKRLIKRTVRKSMGIEIYSELFLRDHLMILRRIYRNPIAQHL